MEPSDILRDCGLSGECLGELLEAFRQQLAACHGAARRQMACEGVASSLVSWGRKHLRNYFALPPSAMHRWLGNRLDRMSSQRGVKLNVLAPRGSAKSTVASLAYPLREALARRERYIWIVSDTARQACAHLQNLKSELLDNRTLVADYPGATGRGVVWQAGSIVLANGVAIEAFGTGQHIRGRRHRADRPTLIICDDLQNDNHMVSPGRRRQSRDWFFGALVPAGTPDTNFVNLATALHRDALAMELCRTSGWTSRVFQAIRRWPDNTSLWQEWSALYTNTADPRYQETARAFYEGHRDAMNAGAVVLWPEREDLYTLMCMRAEGGHAAFEREKQNSPINPEACEWPERYFNDRIWFDIWPRQLRVRAMAIDPSKGADARRGDYSAMVVLGVDDSGLIYVEADLARRPVDQIVADGVAMYRRFRPDALGVESNQFQELLGAQFMAEFRRQGVLGVAPWLLDNQVNKLVRIRRLGPYLASGRLRFKSDSPSTQLLVEQIKDFPLGDHDDGPDAMEMALRLAAELLAVPDDDGLGDRLPV